MSDLQPTQPTVGENPSGNSSITLAMIVYGLYLLNLILPFSSLVGLIMAYINRGDAEAYQQTHYQFQIRTFWIGLLYGVIGLLLTSIGIGWLILALTALWLIVRCAIGMKYLTRRQALPNPTSWLFGN